MLLAASLEPKLATVLAVLGVVVLIGGRFHFVFRDRSEAGDFPTGTSCLLRLGSLVITILLWSTALVVWLSRAG